MISFPEARAEILAHADRFVAGSRIEGHALLLLPRGEDGAGSVDNRTVAVRVEAAGDVLAGRTLRAVTRHEEEGMRHTCTQAGTLLRIGRADDSADHGIAGLAAGLLAPLLDQIRHGLIQRAAVLIAQILQLTRRLVARLHQRIHAGTVRRTGVHERLDAVHAQIRVDGRNVGRERLDLAVRHFGHADIGVGVAGSGRTDVVALDVSHDDHALLFGVSHGLFKGDHARGAVHLVVGNLHLDGRHNVAERVDEAHIVLIDSLRGVLKAVDAARHDFLDELLRQILDAGIKARNGRVLQFADAVVELVHDIHNGFPPVFFWLR